MRTIIDAEQFDVDEYGENARLLQSRFVLGFIAGLVAILLPILIRGEDWAMGPTRRSSMVLLLVIPVTMGLGFCTLAKIRIKFGQWVSPSIRAIYGGTSALAVPPPPGSEFDYLVPCNWVKFDSYHVGGVLYLGAGGLLFIPHSHQYGKPQIQRPLAIERLDGLSFFVTPAKLTFFEKLRYKRTPAYLGLGWEGREARFAVPNPESTRLKLESVVAELQSRRGEIENQEGIGVAIAGRNLHEGSPLEKVIRG